jgi:hypothetical protein
MTAVTIPGRLHSHGVQYGPGDSVNEKINISHLFASATINQDVCLVVLKVLNTSDNGRAIVLLYG